MRRVLPKFEDAKTYEEVVDGKATGQRFKAVVADDRFDIPLQPTVTEEQLYDEKGVPSGKKKHVAEHGSIRGNRGDGILQLEGGAYRVVPMREFTAKWRWL